MVGKRKLPEGCPRRIPWNVSAIYRSIDKVDSNGNTVTIKVMASRLFELLRRGQGRDLASLGLTENEQADALEDDEAPYTSAIMDNAIGRANKEVAAGGGHKKSQRAQENEVAELENFIITMFRHDHPDRKVSTSGRRRSRSRAVASRLTSALCSLANFQSPHPAPRPRHRCCNWCLTSWPRAPKTGT
jgi:hypothetical protein